MPTSDLIHLKPGFSWERLSMVARYYYPALKAQIILYPLVAIGLAVIQYALSRHEVGVLFSGMLSTVLNFMIYLAPCIFVRRGDRFIETLLPATGVEKSLFIISYCLIFIPLVTLGLDAAVPQLLSTVWPIPDDAAAFATELNRAKAVMGGGAWVQLAQEYIPLSTCMFCVMALKHNRMTMSIVWTIVSLVSLTVAGGILGIVVAVSEGFREGMIDGMAGPAPANIDGDALAMHIISQLKGYLYILSGISVAYTMLMTWLTYRKISGIQL